MEKRASDEETDRTENFQEYLEIGISKLMEIWTDLGLSRKDVLLRRKVMIGHLRDLLDDMVREEESTRQSIVNSVKAYHQEVLKLCGELKLEPYNPNEELTVLQLEKDLRLKLESLQKEKAKKMERLKSLTKIDQELCNLLCEIPFYVPSGNVPSEEQLSELDRHIRKLEDEKDQREQILKQTKEQIKEMLLQLDIPLASQFEQEVVSESDDAFVLSSENMKLLAVFHDRLQKRLKENIETAERLTTELYYLWDQLGISITERTQFSEEYTGIKQRTILALNEEINRCKILKIQNASMIIGSLRKQLDKLWDRCYIPSEQRKMFKAFCSDEWNEELLVKHEEEIRMLKAYYEEHKSLFEKVQHRDMVWEQFLEFERRASNPNRLFDKGWSLLQEEKERKKITKELPRIENEVMEEIDLWQKKTNKTFLINGLLYQEYIKMQWDDYKMHKENEKHSRQQNKQRKTEEEMLFGSRPHVTPVKKPLISVTGGSKSSSKNSAKTLNMNQKPTHMMLNDGGGNIMKQPILDLRMEPASETFLLSQTMVGSSEIHKHQPDVTIAPVDPYSEFELRLNEKIRSHTRSSIVDNMNDDDDDDDEFLYINKQQQQ